MESVEGRPSAELRFLVVYNSLSEFPVEREVLWRDVVPEINNFAVASGFDLEFSDLLVGPSPALHSPATLSLLNALEHDNVIVLCLLGQLYGDPELPPTLRKHEFQAIRAAAFEESKDVALLNQFYTVDRSVETETYRLSGQSMGVEAKEKLLSLIQEGAESAFNEGLLNQANPDRQHFFFHSPLQNAVAHLISEKHSNKVIFVLRNFESPSPPISETTEAKIRAIEDLKNLVSANCNPISFILPGDFASFINSKALDKYRQDFCTQVLDKLKGRMSSFASLPSYSTPQEICTDENRIHEEYAYSREQTPWIPTRKVESRMDKIMSQTKTGLYLIQGPPECGKTRILCRMWNELKKKTKDAITVIRFVRLSYGSLYAHELWYLICMWVCQEARVSWDLAAPCLDVGLLLSTVDSLLENFSRPIYVFIDDLHLLKNGRLLCPRKNPKMECRMRIIATSASHASLLPIFPILSTANLELPSEGEYMQILKSAVPKGRIVSSEQWTAIKEQLSTEGRLQTLGKALVDDSLSSPPSPLAVGLGGRLDKIEGRIGAEAVAALVRALLHSRIGMTRCEMMEFLSCNESVLSFYRGSACFPPVLLDEIFEAFGSLLQYTILDNRKVYRISTPIAYNFLSVRYAGEKQTICVQLVQIMLKDGSFSSRALRETGSYSPLPRKQPRDDGSTHIRVLRTLWYFLLHSGNMDTLKEAALCNFPFLDACLRQCGVAHLLTAYEDTLLHVLHHDIQVLAEQVLLPALPTIVRDRDQSAAEVIGRLRFTRAENSHFLNSMVEEAMGWVDGFGPECLLVPLSCWVAPPQMSVVLSFDFKEWKKARVVLAPTFNHQHILVSGNDAAPGEIYMVHVASQIVLVTYKGHSATVTSICESAEGGFFTSTSLDKTVRIWDRSVGGSCRLLRPHTQKILCSVLSADNTFLVTGSGDSSAKVIDIASGQVINNFPDHTGSVVSVQLTSNNLFLITGSGDFTVQMWNLKKSEIAIRMGGLMAPVTCVAITSNDAFVAVACEDETLRVFSTVSGQELHDMSGHDGKVNALVAAGDDCQLFAATFSRIFCYDIHSGQILLIWDTEVKSPVSSLKITSDNNFLISGCGAAVHVWNIRERIQDGLERTQESEGHVTAIALSPDEKVAACGTAAGIVGLWDLDVAQCLSTVVQAKRVQVTSLAFSYDSSIVLSGNAYGTVSLIETGHGRILRSLRPHEHPVNFLCWVEGRRVVSVDGEGGFRVWEAYEEEEEGETASIKIEGVLPPIHVSANTPNVFISFVTGNPNELRVWNLMEGGDLGMKSKLQHTDRITAFAAATNGHYIVTASEDKSLKVWVAATGFLTQVLAEHEAAVTCCAVSENEKFVVSGGADCKVMIWDVSSGSTTWLLSSRAPVSSVAVTWDGAVAFSADQSGWLQAWSSDTGQLLSSFNAHSAITGLVCSLDAVRLLLKLPHCAQLPILCLHNTPAGHERKRGDRNPSVSSLTSTTSDAKETAPTGETNGIVKNGPVKAPAPRPTFDKMERSKSRLSIGVEKDKSSHTSMGQSQGSPTNRSKACTII